MSGAAVYPGVRGAHHYVRDVVDGTILANRWVRLACERHRNDLIRSAADPAWPYMFDAAAAERAIKFIELMPHVKGKWAAKRQRLVLSGWQKFLVASIFGWVERAATDGRHLRRFRDVTLIVPRKNGKSILAAAIGLYMFAVDGEFGAEVYSGATTEKQAWEVFKPARLMVLRTPAMRRRWKITVAAKSLQLPDGSKFEPVVGTPGDGASPSCALIDEYHEHQSDQMVETMETGMGARDQPMRLVITTAGSNIEGPCYALQKEMEAVLAGTVVDDRAFALLYGIDADDDFRSDDALIKANPNINVSVTLDFLRRARDTALRQPRKLASFKTKHLNIWVQARDPYFDMEQWAALADPTLTVERFADVPCWKGLDLNSKEDLACDIKLFRIGEGSDAHYYVIEPRFYLPEAAAEDADKRHYQGWAEQGYLTVTDGEIIDFREIKADLLDDLNDLDVQEIGYDPWGATLLISDLVAEADAPVVEVPQRVNVLSEPMKWVAALMKAGRIHHDDSPVMTWCMANVTAKEDANENVFPRKERAQNKIDGAVALIMALSRAMSPEHDDGVITQGFVEI